MKRLSLRLSSLFATAALLCLGQASIAQSNATSHPEDIQGMRVREIHPRPTPTPFPIDAHTKTMPELEFRAPSQMTAADRDLALANEAEIARRAELQGFGLVHAGADDTGWGYEQAVCPVFPDHLILEYSRANGPGDITLFSAVIPRGDGHVRVIPVRRRGYSLFTPASSNALTLNDFNHMVKEGHEGLPPDWLTLGLCYAALAGGHVRAALVSQEAYPLFPPAKLSVSGKGGAEVRFADVTPHIKAMRWTLSFAQNGSLLKVQHRLSGEVTERPLRPTVAEKAVPVRGTAVDFSKTGN